tara:strand:+ start:5069 stop:5227 length:159 start_codon:yes stop_codon:yes gene_type:complete
MTLNEGILVANLLLSIGLVWAYTKLNQEVKMLFEGLAITMETVGLGNPPDGK